MVMVFPFCILSTTVLAEPAVAQVKEVSRLMHKPDEVNFVL